eukprot:3597596-Rhodomonas_salina.2
MTGGNIIIVWQYPGVRSAVNTDTEPQYRHPGYPGTQYQLPGYRGITLKVLFLCPLPFSTPILTTARFTTSSSSTITGTG